MWLAANAKWRAIVRVVSQAFSGCLTDPVGAHRGNQIFARYQEEFSKLPGWFLPEAQVAWDCLLCFQDRQEIRGNMLEIGVWRGKSAALSTLYARQDETCAFVDRMMLAEFKETIGLIKKSHNLFLEMSSDSLATTAEIMQMGSTFRWIHIDGEHSGESAQRDLTVAHRLLAEKGVICIDDFPSCAYPQISFAVINFLNQHPNLTMIACGHNKGYICRAECAADYLVFIRDDLHREMSARGAEVTIWKSGRRADWNCFGITDRVEMFDYRGPDWNPLQIEI